MRGAPEPHERLKAQGQSATIFVSHQWRLGCSAVPQLDQVHPDPTGAQLSVLREALQRIMAGQLKALRQEAPGEDMMGTLDQLDHDSMVGHSGLEATPTAGSMCQDVLENCHAERDWFAIPQITARVGGVNEDVQRSDAAKAVQSIPGYVEVRGAQPRGSQ
eukprot:Skav216649  [mRNA]  locus=scaffold1255:258920:262044:+ [translate_table: standard]